MVGSEIVGLIIKKLPTGTVDYSENTDGVVGLQEENGEGTQKSIFGEHEVNLESIPTENTKAPKKRKKRSKGAIKQEVIKLGRVVASDRLGYQLSSVGIQEINTGLLVGLQVEGEDGIQIEGSWAGLIDMLINMLYDTDPDNFFNNMAEYKVLGPGLKIHSEFVKYSHSDDFEYSVFKVKDTEVYIEIRYSAETYVRAINGLLSALEIDVNNIVVDILSLNKIIGKSKSKAKVYLELHDTISIATACKIKITTKSMPITSLNKSKSKGIKVNGISIFASKHDCKDIIQASQLFMLWGTQLYDSDFLKAAKKESLDNIGVCSTSQLNNIGISQASVKISDGMYFYTSGDVYTTILYMCKLCDKVGILADFIELYYIEYEVEIDRQ